MVYMGLDQQRAASLAATLRANSAQMDSVQHLLSAAMVQSDIPVPVDGLLDQIAQSYNLLASLIDRARHELGTFQLALERFALAMPAARDPGLQPWNQVRQDASHNSYVAPGGIAAIHRAGIGAFELDIHRGDPTDFTPTQGPLARIHPWLAIAVDHLGHQSSRADDWRVYHSSIDPMSEYEFLSHGLRAVAELPTSDPITIFIDNKDSFGGSHTPEQLDELLVAELGERLYTPSDVMDRDARAPSLYESIARNGWPTAAELQGRIMVVLTDEVDGYDSLTPVAFIARAPAFDEVDGELVHAPSSDTIFYNGPAFQLESAELEALQTSGVVVRTYANQPCDPNPGVTYRAIDVDPSGPICHP